MSRSFGGTSLTTSPSTAISPPVMSSRPAIMRSVVDLPQPDGPTRTTNSRSLMARLMSLTAVTGAYALCRVVRTTSAMTLNLVAPAHVFLAEQGDHQRRHEREHRGRAAE